MTIIQKEELLGPKRKIKELEKKFNFKPQLSKNSSKLGSLRDRSQQNIHESLYKEDSALKERKSKIVADRSETEVQGCSFKPQIADINHSLSLKAKERYANGEGKRVVNKPLLPDLSQPA